MATYLLAYHGGGMPQDEAQRNKIMAAWGEWMGSLGDNLIDGGNPVGQTKSITSGGAVSDGGGANPVSGYSLIKADSMDQALAYAKKCPILGEGGGNVELCETFNAM